MRFHWKGKVYGIEEVALLFLSHTYKCWRNGSGSACSCRHHQSPDSDTLTLKCTCVIDLAAIVIINNKIILHYKNMPTFLGSEVSHVWCWTFWFDFNKGKINISHSISLLCGVIMGFGYESEVVLIFRYIHLCRNMPYKPKFLFENMIMLM